MAKWRPNSSSSHSHPASSLLLIVIDNLIRPKPLFLITFPLLFAAPAPLSTTVAGTPTSKLKLKKKRMKMKTKALNLASEVGGIRRRRRKGVGGLMTLLTHRRRRKVLVEYSRKSLIVSGFLRYIQFNPFFIVTSHTSLRRWASLDFDI